MSSKIKTLALFVDVQNIYYTIREAYGPRQFNYRQFWQQQAAHADIFSATAYATRKNDPGQMKFQAARRHIGFEVKLKPYIQRQDGSRKGDWDVGITIDVLDIAPRVDEVILLSGDGDFDLLLEKVMKTHGVITRVYGVPELTARSLKESATHYHPIEMDLLL